MADVRASQPWNSGPLAPVTRDLFFIHSKIPLVRGNGAATAKHDPRHSPDLGVAGDVKQQSIDPVECLPRFFQHKDMSVEVRLQWRAKNLAKDRHVKCRGLLRAADAALQRLRRAVH